MPELPGIGTPRRALATTMYSKWTGRGEEQSQLDYRATVESAAPATAGRKSFGSSAARAHGSDRRRTGDETRGETCQGQYKPRPQTTHGNLARRTDGKDQNHHLPQGSRVDGRIKGPT